MNKYTLILLSLTGGFVSGLAWTDWCTGLVLLFGFTPFFLIEHHISENREKYTGNAFFIFLIPGFLLFCIITLGWIRAVSMVAALAVIITVSFLMSFTLWAASAVKMKTGIFAGWLSFTAFWLTFEFIFLSVDLFSPWANLGNGLAKDIRFIQWYEVTGTSGGTLWILASNLILSSIMTGALTKKIKRNRLIIIWLSVIITPSLISLYRHETIKPSDNSDTEILIVQPNMDPYTQKFTIPFEKQVQKIISVAKPEITGETKWLITPETTVDDPVNERNLQGNKYIGMMKSLAVENPGLNIVTGMVTFKSSDPETGFITSLSDTIQSMQNVDIYNSALLIDTGSSVGIYHKTKLVAGFETGFFPAAAKLLDRILPQLGGTNRSYSKDGEILNFRHPETNDNCAPIICFESLFGKHVARFVKKGANMLFIITNDGWWKNKTGYKQHLHYASLRAIETRRPVARAANTGISCFVDMRGNITEQTGWWTDATLRGNLTPETIITPYVRFGDLILYIAAIVSVLIITRVFIISRFRSA